MAVCPYCASPLPSAGAPGSFRPARPGFIPFLALFLAVWGVMGLILSVVLLQVPMNEYRINGELVSREEFLAAARLPLTFGRPLFLAALASAWALWREKPWGRHAVMGMAGLSVLLTAVLARSVAEMRPFLPLLVVVVLSHAAPLFWYFYRKKNVAAYYHWLGRRG